MNPLSSIRAVIFDFDGVIADTIPLHFQSFRELFATEGVDFSFEDYKTVANGAARAQTIRAVMGEGLTEEKFQFLMDRKEQITFELAARNGLHRNPGVIEFARACKDRGLLLGMASSSRMAVQFVEMLGYQDLFDAMSDSQEVERAKPSPDVFLLTARKLDIHPEQCLVVEDSVVGVQAGHNAGMSVLGVTTTTTAEKLKNADWIVDDFEGLDPARFLGEPSS